jgi:hypothetical protein
MVKVKGKSTPKSPATTKKPSAPARAAILSLGAAAMEIHHLQDLIVQVGIAVSLCGGDDRPIELLDHWARAIGRHIGVVLEYFTTHPVKV